MFKYLLVIIGFVSGSILGFVIGFKLNDTIIATLHTAFLSNPVLCTFAGLILGAFLTWISNYFYDEKKVKREQKYTISFIISSLNHSFKRITELYGFMITDLRTKKAFKFKTVGLFSDIDKNDLLKFNGILIKNAFLDFNLFMRQLEHLKNEINNLYAKGYVLAGWSIPLEDHYNCASDFLLAFINCLSPFSEKIKQNYNDYLNQNIKIENITLYSLYFSLIETFFRLQQCLIEIIKNIENSKIELDEKTKQTLKDLKSYREFIDKSFL